MSHVWWSIPVIRNVKCVWGGAGISRFKASLGFMHSNEFRPMWATEYDPVLRQKGLRDDQVYS